MKILSLDSSACAASVALADEKKLIGEYYINTSFTHSRTLVPMIGSLLATTDTAVSDIDMIAVSNGPGSFTGVRIGVSVAKGLAFADDLPCFEVSTLESMAYNLILTDCIVCAVMDAKRSQVYNALFEICYGEITRLCPDRAIALEQLKAELNEKYPDSRIILVGDGTELAFKELMDIRASVEPAPTALRLQRASSVAAAAQSYIARGEKPKPAWAVLPSYLRLSQAERELKKKTDSVISDSIDTIDKGDTNK